ncbi:MAG: hypothetical protein ABIO88_06865, partial [Burkholderiaceae bacterium]
VLFAFYLVPTMDARFQVSPTLLVGGAYGNKISLLPAYSRWGNFKGKQGISPLGLSRVYRQNEPVRGLFKTL